MANFVIKQGEAKTLTLTVTDQNGEAVDLTGATLALTVKAKKTDTEETFAKEDADFNKSQQVEGIVSVFLTATDTNQTPGPYMGELKAVWPGVNEIIEKSQDCYLTIEGAITDDE